jgi:hypothetical protein
LPATPEWFDRLPGILAAIKNLPGAELDRSVFEAVFAVGRRQAIYLMGQFGARKAGQTFICNRSKVISKLERMHDDYLAEEERKARVFAELEVARRLAPARRIRIETAQDVCQRRLGDLPAGIHLKPGELRIEFLGTEDLLRHLYELSQAITNDYAQFAARCEEPAANGTRSQAEQNSASA